MRLEDQLKTYAQQIDASQEPVSGDEALRRVDTIRVGEEPTRVSVSFSPKQKLAGVGAIAAVFLMLFGTSLWFGRGLVATEDPAASNTPTTAPGNVASNAEPVQRIDTPLGTWVWQRLDTPLGHVAEFNGFLYSVRGPQKYDGWGNRTDPIKLDAPQHVIASSDGITWEERPVPDAATELYLYVREQRGRLVLIGEGPDSPFPDRFWSSDDGVTWTEIDGSPWGVPADLSVPGITAEGARVEITQISEPVELGNVRVEHGAVNIRFPEEVETLLWRPQYATSEASNGTHRLFFSPVDDDGNRLEGDPVVEAVIDVDESADGTTTIDYAFWNGPESEGDLLHRAHVEIASEFLAEPMDPDRALHPWIEILWRSEGSSQPEVVPLPLTRPTELARFVDNIQHVTVIDGQFVVYGSALDTSTTRINEYVTRIEPGRVAVIATSEDGLTWQTNIIEGFVNPQYVADGADVPAMWEGSYQAWVTEDGLTGTLVDVPVESGIIQGPSGTLLLSGYSYLRMSTDGESWFDIPLPEEPSERGRGLGAVGDVLFFSNEQPEFTWVGYFNG